MDTPAPESELKKKWEFNRRILLLQAKRLDRNKKILEYFKIEGEIEQMNFELITELMK